MTYGERALPAGAPAQALIAQSTRPKGPQATTDDVWSAPSSWRPGCESCSDCERQPETQSEGVALPKAKGLSKMTTTGPYAAENSNATQLQRPATSRSTTFRLSPSDAQSRKDGNGFISLTKARMTALSAVVSPHFFLPNSDSSNSSMSEKSSSNSESDEDEDSLSVIAERENNATDGPEEEPEPSDVKSLSSGSFGSALSSLMTDLYAAPREA